MSWSEVLKAALSSNNASRVSCELSTGDRVKVSQWSGLSENQIDTQDATYLPQDRMSQVRYV